MSPSRSPPLSPSPRPSKRPRPISTPSTPTRTGSSCPYMPTFSPASLDFDLPRLCQVSLQSHNIYVCLICGKYLQGRSPTSPAYAHSLQTGHHLFLNLSTRNVYCLPEMYRVTDPLFTRLSQALRPTFTSDEIQQLDAHVTNTEILGSGLNRLAGAVPLDSVHAPRYATCVLQLLMSARSWRNHLLATLGNEQRQAQGGELEDALAALCGSIWADVAVRSTIAPNVMLHAVTKQSKGRFGKEESDPIMFLAWLLNALTGDVAESAKDAFRGEMEVEKWRKGVKRKTSQVGFWFLPLDLPPRPLFKAEGEKANVQQIKLETLITKYDGVKREMLVGTEKLYRIIKWPRYLIFVIKRFANAKTCSEKNKCVVHLPESRLEVPEGRNPYRLVGAILHEGEGGGEGWRVAVHHFASKSWFDLSETEAKSTVEQLISLADTYILLYEELLPRLSA